MEGSWQRGSGRKQVDGGYRQKAPQAFARCSGGPRSISAVVRSALHSHRQRASLSCWRCLAATRSWAACVAKPLTALRCARSHFLSAVVVLRCLRTRALSSARAACLSCLSRRPRRALSAVASASASDSPRFRASRVRHRSEAHSARRLAQEVCRARSRREWTASASASFSTGVVITLLRSIHSSARMYTKAPRPRRSSDVPRSSMTSEQSRQKRAGWPQISSPAESAARRRCSRTSWCSMAASSLGCAGVYTRKWPMRICAW
mmetsp:Transcript_121884/g.339844  ORF Transcript_121884/g.339844 Transcript_121884/m.339844 type:complete len:263 (+) Transcript_121884:62-850(+)